MKVWNYETGEYDKISTDPEMERLLAEEEAIQQLRNTIYVVKPGWLCTCGASELTSSPYTKALCHWVQMHRSTESTKIKDYIRNSTTILSEKLS